MKRSARTLLETPHWLWGTRFGRVLALVVAASGGAFVSLLWLSNVLIGGGGLEWVVSQSTDDVRLQLGRAYSPWPGRIVFRDLHLEIHDSAVHFDLRVPKGEVHVDLFALLDRRFEGSDLEASGAILRVRTAPPHRSREREARLPNLSAPKTPHGVTRASDLWGVAVGIENLDLTEVWIDDARLEGDVAVTGGFDLQPMDYLEVAPSTIELSETHVYFGSDRLSRALRGAVEMDIPRTSVTQKAGERLLEQGVFRAQLATHVESLAPLGAYLAEGWGVGGGEGELSLDVRLRHLELDDDSRLSYRSSKLEVRHGRLRASGASRLLVAQGRRTFARWSLSKLKVARGSEDATRVAELGQAARLELTFEADGPLHRLTPERGKADVEGIRVRDLSVLEPDLPRSLQRIQGTLTGNAQGHYADGVIRVDTSFHATNLALGSTNLGLSADAWLSAAGTSRAPFRKLELSKLNLDLRDARVTQGSSRSAPFRAALRTTSYTVGWSSLRAEGPLRVELSDTRPLERATDVEPPEIAKSLFGLEGLELSLQTRLSETLQDVRILEGKSGSARIDGRMVRRDDDARVVLLISRGLLSVGIAAWADDSSVVPLAGDDWLKEQLGRI